MTNAVKFVKGSDTMIEGLAIPFGGPMAGKDLDGESFSADTNYAFDWFPQGRPVIYHHGFDNAMKTAVQGRQFEHEITEEGVWARGQLDTSAKYHATVAKLITAGKLYFSSGSVDHLFERTKDGHITRWPWVELSLTPTPANPYAVVHTVKSSDIAQRFAGAELPVPGELIAAALKALDSIPVDRETEGPGSESFDDQGARVASEVTRYVERAQKRFDTRSPTKAGRVLSATNRAQLAAVLDALDGFGPHSEALRKLLAETDPEAEKALTAAVFEALATESRLLGVPV